MIGCTHNAADLCDCATYVTRAYERIAKELFEEYARNSGNNPAEHFNPDAAMQWMLQALHSCGLIADRDNSMRYKHLRTLVCSEDGPTPEIVEAWLTGDESKLDDVIDAELWTPRYELTEAGRAALKGGE